MPNNGTSVFAHIIGLIDRNIFARTVRTYNGDTYAKGFTCWQQLVSMEFLQFGKAQSLSEICLGLGTCIGRLSHLGLGWQIEIFFKTIKQHLKIKTFVGTTANTVKRQLWTALITILLLKM
jgi:hypothetical protein